jgi:8-oxoguanine deaminase
MLLLENIDALYSSDDAGRVIRGAHVVIRGDRIEAVGGGASPQGDFSERIDLSGHIVTAGLVNVHHHFFQSLTRAIPAVQRGHLLTWLMSLYPVWGRMTPDDLAAATQAACAELLLSGVTVTSDHCYLVPRADPDYLEAEIEAALGMGVRLNLVRGSMTRIEADLGEKLSSFLGPDAGGLVDSEEIVLREMRRALEKHHRPGKGSYLTMALGPTTVVYEDPAFMRNVADMASDFACGLHTHFHPRPDERELTSILYGRAPVDALDDMGWLRPGTWIAHGTRLDAHDMSLLADRGVALAHCPRMIMRLGARLIPLHDVLSSGMRVGIGVDGAASNDCGSMVAELRIAALLHRLAGGEGNVPHNSWLDPLQVLHMATRDGAVVIGRPDLGRIEVGAPADIAAFDLRGVGYAGARTDLLSGFILAGSENRASMTIVGGKIKVRNGMLTEADEYKIRERLDRATERLIGEVSLITGWDYRSFSENLEVTKNAKN